MGTSCLALVWVMGRRRVPAPPARMRPLTGWSFLQDGTGGAQATRSCRGSSGHRQAEVAGDDQALDLAGALADLEDLGVPVLARHRRLVDEPVAPEDLGSHPRGGHRR